MNKLRLMGVRNISRNMYNMILNTTYSVYPGILYVNGMKSLRYSTRFDKSNWRFGKRQDLLAQSRYFMWKQPINNAHQLQSSVKAPIIPYNFNRYGMVPPAAAMAPILQNYMFAMPTKVNYPLYQQSIQDINDKRKPGNLHHITIINAIMPKPYMPTPPTYAHPTTTFRNYRTNNKFLHQQYLNNFARQNMEHFNNVNAQHKLQQQQQLQKHQMVYPLNTYALNINKPTMDLTNLLSYNTVSNNSSIESYGVNNMKSESVSACGRKNKDDSNNSASDIMYYYCNNRITNYKNPTQYQIVSTQTTTAAPTTTSTTTTTTERPSTTTTRIVRTSFDYFTTEKPIFLPTPNEPLEANNIPVASLTNTITNEKNEGNFNNREHYSSNRYEDIRTDPSLEYQPRKTLTRYDDLRRKQQQQYTTAAVYDNMKLHSFFTIEDAVTKAPEMQVFNDPYQAYRHARRHHHSHQRQTTTPITTTTSTTTKPKYKSFFDDLEDEDYTTSEAHHYDYSFFGNPQKSTYQKPLYRSEQKYTQPNQIIDQTYKTIDDNIYITESYEGKPKIKEHHFGLFKSISPTRYTAPPITTYKPYDRFKELTLTTHKTPHNFVSYKSRSIPTTTTDLIMSNRKEIETTTDSYPLQVRTSTITPMTTTTEKKVHKIKLKSPLTLKTPTTYKYPKHRGIKKPYKTLTSTTTTKATPTLKKIPKYQRQFKVKKLKQFKHLFTTTSTSSSTTTTTSTTTAIPSTTVENYTKRASSRIFPITSTTEEPTTRKILSRTITTTDDTKPTTRKISSRTITTTDGTKARKSTGRKQISTESANTGKKTVTRVSVESTTTLANTFSRKQVSRRGSKRANKTRTEKEVSSTATAITRRSEPKSRRRLTPTPITPKPDVKRSTSSITFTPSSTTSPTRSTSTSTTTTTTTMRSIMRIANSKLRSRTQAQNEIKSSIKTYNDIESATFDNRGSFKSITSTGASVPPLPIEIYFKKSQNAKI